jgi:Tfp pilus assembly PilM family ATPase
MAQIGVGVDIGHSSIKIIEIVKKKQQFELLGCAKIDIPPGTISDDGLIIDKNLVIEALQQICRMSHIKQKKVVSKAL